MDGERENTDLSANESGRDSPPQIPMDSPGSSVSSRLQEEYSQLLKYTVESTPGLRSFSTLHETNNITSVSETAKEDGGKTATAGQDSVSAILTLDGNVTQNNNGTAGNSKSIIDMSVVAMGGKLDGWLGKLKENIMEELLSSLMASLDHQQDEHKKATLEIHAEKAKLEKEVNRLNELTNGLEHSLQQKVTVVKNLTDCLALQKKKLEVAKSFFYWKAENYDKQREIFTEKMAVQHHERKLNMRVLKAWYGVIQTRWRGRVERKCQTQAQGMCLDLTNDYESKISALNDTISSLEKKVNALQAERETYSEQVKKAFMRGMCALNMETMSVFGEEQKQQKGINGGGGVLAESSGLIEDISDSDIPSPDTASKCTSHTKSISSELAPIASTSPSSISHSHPYISHSPVRAGQQTHSLPDTQHNVHGNKHGTVMKCKSKAVKAAGPGHGHGHGKIVSASQVLAPPMASIVVERHQPINKKTVGKATAVRYPKRNTGGYVHATSNKDKVSAPTHFKPLAGQERTDMYIKVVE